MASVYWMRSFVPIDHKVKVAQGIDSIRNSCGGWHLDHGADLHMAIGLRPASSNLLPARLVQGFER